MHTFLEFGTLIGQLYTKTIVMVMSIISRNGEDPNSVTMCLGL
jgi:hypothetical protein